MTTETRVQPKLPPLRILRKQLLVPVPMPSELIRLGASLQTVATYIDVLQMNIEGVWIDVPVVEEAATSQLSGNQDLTNIARPTVSLDGAR